MLVLNLNDRNRVRCAISYVYQSGIVQGPQRPAFEWSEVNRVARFRSSRWVLEYCRHSFYEFDVVRAIPWFVKMKLLVQSRFFSVGKTATRQLSKGLPSLLLIALFTSCLFANS